MPVSRQPIITLTTDFGTEDFYVAAMKAVLLRECPGVAMIDVTHAVPRHDILFGSIMLERALAAFPRGTIHLAVVDPGVGTSRRILVSRWPDEQIIVCPDNGMITWAARRRGMPRTYELLWRPPQMSHVFHGRDIMAPVAGMLAAGRRIEELSQAIEDPVLLDIAPARSIADGGTIIHFDHFGNATTNSPEELIAGHDCKIRIAGRSVGLLQKTYGDVATGEPLALIGSSGLLEIAVREGSARDALQLHVRDQVVVVR